MLTKLTSKNNVIAMFLAGGMSALTVVNGGAAKAEDMTAGSVLKRFSTNELHLYLTGIIEGLKYARYEKEGKTTKGGWRCIHDWYFNDKNSPTIVLRALRKYPDHMPNAVMAALIKQKCGE